LPLSSTTRVALIGRHALETVNMGGGSAQVIPPHQVSIAEGLRERLGDAARVVDGVGVRTRPVAAKPGFLTEPVTGRPGMALHVSSVEGRVLRAEHLSDAKTLGGLD